MKIKACTIKIKNNRSTYPGGKGGSGVHQQIINLIPPHLTYHETHLGAGSIMRHKLPAPSNIGIDIDPNVIKEWKDALPSEITIPADTTENKDTAASLEILIGSGTTSSKMSINEDGLPGYIFKNEDASSYLKNYQFTSSDFVYADPPYVMETRKGGKIYDYEYDDQDHIELLNILKTLPCMVMISGYYSELYMSMLPGWNTHSFQAQTRQGIATEWLWFNYPIPEKLHDYSYLGDTFRDRERIRKKKDRWVARFLKTPVMERNAILQAILESLPDPITKNNDTPRVLHQK